MKKTALFIVLGGAFFAALTFGLGWATLQALSDGSISLGRGGGIATRAGAPFEYWINVLLVAAGSLIGARGLFVVGRMASDLWRGRKGKEMAR